MKAGQLAITNSSSLSSSVLGGITANAKSVSIFNSLNGFAVITTAPFTGSTFSDAFRVGSGSVVVDLSTANSYFASGTVFGIYFSGAAPTTGEASLTFVE